ncbi:MAG: ribonuclease III [Acidobacteria bacterium]|nr:ribonuclease III [Acidobacteriota bacterium]
MLKRLAKLFSNSTTLLPEARATLLREVERRVGHRFKRRTLLDQALTHKSFVNETPQLKLLDNESLEFLGDAVLGYVISSHLFRIFPEMSEGELSKVKAYLVSSANLFKHARNLELGKYLRLSYGEEKTGGRSKKAILVDTYEAMIAALYLDAGMRAAEKFVTREFHQSFSEIRWKEMHYFDYKSSLQETMHVMNLPDPEYKVVDEIGPDHRKIFVVEVLAGDRALAKARGSTKKEAQQEAARMALEALAESQGTR